MPHRGAVALLLFVCLGLYLPGFASLPPMDRDEPRFAQASKQMLETGDFVDIRYQGEARNKKPVGIYWLQAAAVALGQAAGIDEPRRTIWLYRIPSLLGAIVSVLGTYWAALVFTTRRGAVMAALLLASTILLTVEAHLAKTDAVLLSTVVLAMGALARLYPGTRLDTAAPPGWPVAGVFWTAVAVGILVKGPITPMVPAFTVVVLCIRDRSGAWLRALRPASGLAWVLLLVLPWFVMILLRTKGAFIADSLGHDMMGKVAGAQESHGAPPGLYAAVFWGTGWPMTPFVALALPFAWRRRRENRVAFLLAWIVPVWSLFEAVPTKLPHYVLPVYPALAILAVTVLLDAGEAIARRRGLAMALAAGLLMLMPVAILVALAKGRSILWDTLPAPQLAFGIAMAVVLAILALWSARRLLAGDLAQAVGATTIMAVLTYVFVLGSLLAPSTADRLALSASLAQAARTALDPACANGPMASVGDHEPSLVFLTRTDLLLTDAAGAAGFLKGGPCRLAMVERRSEPAFQTALGAEPDVTLARRVTGTAINGAKALDIGIYVRQTLAP